MVGHHRPVTPLRSLATRLPARVRVEVALLILEAMEREAHPSLIPPVRSIVACGWSWVTRGESPKEIHRGFDELIEAHLCLRGTEAALAEPALYAAYCVMWEAFMVAFDASEVGIDDLGSYVCEGGLDLYDRLADTWAQTLLGGVRPERFFAAAVARFEGDPGDRATRVDEDELLDAMEQAGLLQLLGR